MCHKYTHTHTYIYIYIYIYIYVYIYTQVALVIKNLPANAGNLRDSDLIPGLGRYLGGGHGNPSQHSCLESTHGQRSLVCYSP